MAKVSSFITISLNRSYNEFLRQKGYEVHTNMIKKSSDVSCAKIVGHFIRVNSVNPSPLLLMSHISMFHLCFYV